VPPERSALISPCLVNAEPTMAGLSDGLGNRGRLIRGVHVLIIHGNLRAVDDIEGVARFLSSG
jgi:hypothetical protein